jgi:hypothetical protein
MVTRLSHALFDSEPEQIFLPLRAASGQIAFGFLQIIPTGRIASRRVQSYGSGRVVSGVDKRGRTAQRSRGSRTGV